MNIRTRQAVNRALSREHREGRRANLSAARILADLRRYVVQFLTRRGVKVENRR